MSKGKIILSANLFVDLQPFVSTDENRRYISGVHVEPAPFGGGICLVATDGHTLGCLHDPFGCIVGGTRILRLQREALQIIRAHLKEAIPAWLVAEGEPGDNTLRVVLAAHGEVETNAHCVATFSNCMLNENFPDWRRVVPDGAPSSKPDVRIGFQARYMAKFDALCPGKKTSTRSVVLTKNENGPSGAYFVKVSRREDFIGVIMGCSTSESDSELPVWYTGKGAS